MCGIAGYLAAGGEPPRERFVRVMCDAMVHRGPDAYGFYCDGEAALGHRRLSIIDLAGGAQPLGNEDGSIQVAFNGEIYNYRELRADLARRGHLFRTDSDTETLVHLYEEEGERMPERLNGMFAFAIWDSRRRELFLARDRFGKKPLYYSFDIPGARFAFASELKALAALPGFKRPLNRRAVADFLALSYIPDPDSIYEGVSKLPPAHRMTVCGEKRRMSRYWEPPFSGVRARSEKDAAAEIVDLARDAVERRMISDVPLGAFLSGGVDSSAAVAMMSEGARVRTFSIGFREKTFDELRYARTVVERYRTEHHERIVTPDIAEIFDTLVHAYDEPFADASAIPMLYLSRMTREHVTVALSGDGADEIFGGYRRYAFALGEERVRRLLPGCVRTPVFGLAGRLYPKFDYLPRAFRAKTTLVNLADELGGAYFTSMSVFQDESLDSILSAEVKRGLAGYSPRECFRSRFRRFAELPPLRQLQAVDFETYLPGDILVKADRATMAYSLEARAPWLDYRLAELAGSLPQRYLVRGRAGKYIFKNAFRPWLPGEILDRPKMGFSIPLAAWFRSSLRPAFHSLVLNPRMTGLISLIEARRIWEEHQRGTRDHCRKLWNLLMLAAWERSRTEPRSGKNEAGRHITCSIPAAGLPPRRRA